MVHPDDGSIWFTDPGYGGLMNYEGKRHNTDPRPFRKEAVYRIDGQTGDITMVTDEPFKPNGMCFSHDYTKVYIADTGASHYSAEGAVHKHLGVRRRRRDPEERQRALQHRARRQGRRL